ncbi:MAG: hypothetical protein WCB68_06675 [Pyrinomonadaceae bacterium]
MADEALGPFLGMAAFCEHILDEKDNVLSAIRLVDRITVMLNEPMTEDSSPFVYAISCLIKFGSFGLSTERELLVKIKTPTGKESEVVRYPIIFQPEKSGINFKIEMNVGFKEAGVYWLLVYLEDTFFTQVPLLVDFVEKENESSESQTKEQP